VRAEGDDAREKLSAAERTSALATDVQAARAEVEEWGATAEREGAAAATERSEADRVSVASQSARDREHEAAEHRAKLLRDRAELSGLVALASRLEQAAVRIEELDRQRVGLHEQLGGIAAELAGLPELDVEQVDLSALEQALGAAEREQRAKLIAKLNTATYLADVLNTVPRYVWPALTFSALLMAASVALRLGLPKEIVALLKR